MLKFGKQLALFLGKVILVFGGFLLIMAMLFWIIKTMGNEKRINMNGVKEQVEIILEESEDSYVERVGKLLYTEHDKNYKLTEYEIDFDRENGSILLNVADTVVVFNYPQSLMVTTDWREEERKVESLYFTLALTPKGRIKNSEARSRVYELIKQLTDAGWERYLDSSSARISGKEAFYYNKEHYVYDNVSLDDKYVLDAKEWSSGKDLTWYFYYKDKAYIHLSVMRERKGREINEEDGYFILIDVTTIAESTKENFKNFYDKQNWKELYPALLKKDNKFREEAEKKAVELGYHIDYEYKDSPLNRGIFDLSKHDDKFDENVTCTKTGYWQSYVASNQPLPQLNKREGEIFFYNAGMVFLEKDEELNRVHDLLRWRFLGTKDEYDLVNGKLIKKVETKEGEKVSVFSNDDVCPKAGYWQSYQHGFNSKEPVVYFKRGESLTLNRKDPLDILSKWKYLGDENDFEVVDGRLVRRV